MVLDVLLVDNVFRKASQGADGLPVLAPPHVPVLVYEDGKSVELDVMVGTQTQQIGQRVRPVVWTSEPLDVCCLAVVTESSLQPKPAHLAPMLVKQFDPVHQPLIAVGA